MTIPVKKSQCHIKDSKRNPVYKNKNNTNNVGKKTNRKTTIPKKLREEVWNHYNKGTYCAKCHVPWCTRDIDVFNFHVGHDIPECQGGSTDIINLKPICSNCNLSMGYKFTITEWSKLKLKKKNFFDNLDLFKLSYSMISTISILLNFYHII
jgi:5-methylcytosine-specific restriction endonuclease McrA